MLLSWKSFIFQQVKLLVLPQHGFILSRLSWTIQTLNSWEHLGRRVMTKLKTLLSSHRAPQHAQDRQLQSCKHAPVPALCTRVTSYYTEPVFFIQMWKRLSLNVLVFYVLLWIKYLFMFPSFSLSWHFWNWGCAVPTHYTGYRSPL